MSLSTINAENSKYHVTRCEKYWVYYNDQKFLDLQMGNASYIFGYNDIELLAAKNQNSAMFVRNDDNETTASIIQLLENIGTHSQLASSCWALSGSDGVEAAIGINDGYWQAQELFKPTILTLDHCYHGTTYLTKSFRGKGKVIPVRHHNLPAPAWIDVEDRAEQEDKLFDHLYQFLDRRKDVGAILVESLPWINGVLPFSQEFWKKLREICNYYNINLIIDDVAGFGKTSGIFSHVTFGIVPDIVAIGKSLTGGYVPFSAAVANQKIEAAINQINFDHSHTWCPSIDGVNVANAVFEKLKQDSLKIPVLEDKFYNTILSINNKIKIKGQGLLQDICIPVTDNKLYDCGVIASLKSNYSFTVVIPLIADDEYFEAIYNRIGKLV